MAHLHFKRTVYRSGGGTATKRLEYITRQPERDAVAADRQLRYLREDREDLVYERSRNLPAWAEGNPHTYFSAAERYERVNGVAFEEWKVTLPQELSHRQNLALTRDLVDAIAGTRLPITYAFHDPPTLDGTRQQPHLHLLLSARQNDAHIRTAATTSTGTTGSTPSAGAPRRTRCSGTRAPSRRTAYSSVMWSTPTWSMPGRRRGSIPAGSTERALTARPNRSSSPARAGPTASRGRSVPVCRRSWTSGRPGQPRCGSTGTGAGAAVLGGTEGRTRDHGHAAHGPQALRDPRGPRAAP